MKQLVTLVVSLILLSGCVNFDNSVFRTEAILVNSAHGSVQGFNQYYNVAVQTPDTNVVNRLNQAKAQVYDASRKFAAAATVLDSSRQSYKTSKSEVDKNAIKVALDVLQTQSTNIVAMVKYFMNNN